MRSVSHSFFNYLCTIRILIHRQIQDFKAEVLHFRPIDNFYSHIAAVGNILTFFIGNAFPISNNAACDLLYKDCIVKLLLFLVGALGAKLRGVYLLSFHAGILGNLRRQAKNTELDITV